MSVFIEKPEIAGMKPAGSDSFGRFLGSAIVALHHNGAMNQNFTNAFIVGMVDANLNAPDRFANGADAVVVHWRNGGSCGSFREAVGLDHYIAEIAEISSDNGIKVRTAAGEHRETGTD